MSSSDSLKDNDYNGTPATQVDPEEETLKASNENLYKVVLLGVIFLVMFSAFNSASVLITPIYQQLGFADFGKISTLCIYLAFAFNDFLAPFELKVFGLKVGLFLGGLGYTIFMLGGLLLTACKYEFESTEGICSGGSVIAINTIASIACGISAAMLWLAQSKYIDCCGNKYNKGKFFGVFWSIFQMSFILGNVLGAYILKFFNPFIYFVTMTSLVLLACLSFLLLPPVRDVTAEQEIQRPVGEDIKFRIRGIKRISFMKAFRPMIPYYLYSGFSIAVYSTFSYRVINMTTADSEPSVQNEKLEWCFVAQGVMSVINSSAVGKGSDLFGVKRAINITNVGFLMAMLVAVFATDTEQYWLAVLMVVVWAFGDSSIRTLSNAVISKDFKGRLEAFAATRVITETGVVVGLLISIGLGNVSPYYFIGVIVALTLIMQAIVFFYDPTKIDPQDLEDESVDDSGSLKV